jgi:hypothetical protein
MSREKVKTLVKCSIKIQQIKAKSLNKKCQFLLNPISLKFQQLITNITGCAHELYRSIFNLLFPQKQKLSYLCQSKYFPEQLSSKKTTKITFQVCQRKTSKIPSFLRINYSIFHFSNLFNIFFYEHSSLSVNFLINETSLNGMLQTNQLINYFESFFSAEAQTMTLHKRTSKLQKNVHNYSISDSNANY